MQQYFKRLDLHFSFLTTSPNFSGLSIYYNCLGQHESENKEQRASWDVFNFLLNYFGEVAGDIAYILVRLTLWEWELKFWIFAIKLNNAGENHCVFICDVKYVKKVSHCVKGDAQQQPRNKNWELKTNTKQVVKMWMNNGFIREREREKEHSWRAKFV
jgi:hypothetical protein